MESDFGADLLNDDDDWVQSYADYATYVDEVDSYDYSDYGASFDDLKQNDFTKESLSDLLMSDKILNPSHSKSKSCQRLRDATGAWSARAPSECDRSRNKRKRNKFQSGVEIFLNEVLSWHLGDLMRDCRATLRLPRLVLPSLTYKNFSELTNIVQQVAVEETRAAIVRGCNDPEDSVFFDLCEEPARKKMADTLIPIKFFVRSGGKDLIKPGWIFCLFPHTSESDDLILHKPQKHQHRRAFSYQSSSGLQSIRSQLHKRLYGTSQSGSDICKGVLTTLALGRHSFQNHSSSVTMWVHAESFFSIFQSNSHPGGMPTHWVGYAVENIITHQRVASISYDTPRFPFMSKFLGHKESSHILFDSDSDSDLESPSQGISEKSMSVSGAVIIGMNKKRTNNDCANSENDDSEASDSSDDKEVFAEAKFPPRIDVSGLDSSQRLALINTLSQIDRGYSLGLVQGPPGCGKTFFLVHLLLILVHERSKRVLVSAPSNKAISVIAAQYSKRRLSAWKDDMIVSIGVEDKFDKCKDDDSESEGLSLAEQFEVCEQQLLELWAGHDCCHRVHNSECEGTCAPSSRRDWDNVSPTKNLLPCAFLTEAITSSLATVINPVNVLDVLVYKYASRVATAINYLGIAFSTCVTFHMTSINAPMSCHLCVESMLKAVLNVLAGEYADMIDTLQSVITDFFKATVEIVENHKIFKTSAEKVHANIFECLKRLSRTFDAVWNCQDADQRIVLSCDVKDAAHALGRQLNMLHTIFDSLENSDYIADELLSKARVVCSTLSTAGCGLMKRKSDTFDVLLVDEAGQCLEGELLIPCFLNPSSLVLIGDPQQLPATVLSMEIQEKQLGTSSMQRLMASSSQQQKKQNGFQMLSTQYRMHPQICSFPNERFYQGQLHTGSSVLHRNCLLPGHWLERYPVLFVDMAAEENSGTLKSRSRYNIGEAEMIAKILSDLQLHIQTHPRQHVLDIGIITFYAAQVKVITQQLRKRGVCMSGNNASFRVKVVSVDGFQGSEADIILLSFVRSNLRNSVGFLKDFQRLNVALTRAKHHLVMVGDADTLEKSNCSDLQELIIEMKGRNVLMDKESTLQHVS